MDTTADVGQPYVRDVQIQYGDETRRRQDGEDRTGPGLAGLEGVATPGGVDEFKGMGCSPSRQACTQPVR
ncbi:hypothetical protein AB0D34_19905 [Streptomyces sp. NPDC048420]|uniref:hypothetical protein n=1 Tax=Streptomyces sp. NPDC048420 TaxID=3155755 RepID=UPI0034232B91